MHIELPDKVRLIIRKITDGGYEAYTVGGCVRDSLLGRNPHDWDITTNATPEQVKSLFDRTIDTGIKHGTVTIMYGKEGYEVTTYRIDGEYEDGRHPSEVTFTSDLVEDLRRRDFTINAMAYNDETGLVDAFDGIGDIEKKCIRAVGCPDERFSEDALRIMRAVRFSAQLGYSIELETRKAASDKAKMLKQISAERIRSELDKILMSSNPDKVRDLYEMGISSYILPELDLIMEENQNNPHHMYTVGEHTIHALSESVKYDGILQEEDILAIRLALLFHDMGKPKCKTTDEEGIDHFHGHPVESEAIAKSILRRLKYDNHTISRVLPLVKYHDLKHALTEKEIREDIVRIGKELIVPWMCVVRCDISAQSNYQREDKLSYVDDYEKIYNEIINRGDCVTIKDMAINGRDLIEIGITPGVEMGNILNALFEMIIEDPDKNDREYLLSVVRDKYLV